MGAHVLASSLRSHAAEVVASPVGGRNMRRPVGRTRKNGRADTVISWAGRARPIRPAPCAWYLSFLRLFFPAGAGRCARRSGRKAGSFGWFLVFRATAQHGPRWGGGSVGAFPGGPAGRWRVSFAQPAVVRAGFRPLPLSGCWAVSLPSALPLGCRPARYFNFPPGGGARLLLRPLGRGWDFASLVLPSARPPMGRASVLWGGGWWSSAPAPGVRLAPCRDAPAPSVARARPNAGGSARPPGAGAFCVYGIQSANSSLQKVGVISPQRKLRVGGTAQGAGFPLKGGKDRAGAVAARLGLVPCASSFAIGP